MRNFSLAIVSIALTKRFAIAAFVVMLMAFGLGAPLAQAAAPPANDRLANSTVVSSLPFSETIDISGATSDADDTAVLSPCFAGQTLVTNNSVWYTYTANADTTLAVDSAASNLGTGVVIAERQGGGFGRRVCTIDTGTPARTVMQIGAGVTVSILIFWPGASNLTLSLAVSIYAVKVPANDTIGGATIIPALPFSDFVDPYLATTGAEDGQVNDVCGWGTIPHSVWYSFTAGPDSSNVLFDAFPTNQFSSNAIAIATGSPGALNTVACDPSGAVIIPTSPGTTYFVLVEGGTESFQLNVSLAPPAPTISAHFSDDGRVDRFGVAYLSGTYKCANAEITGIFGYATQTKGRRVSAAPIQITDKKTGGYNLSCDGRRHTFLGTATTFDGGRFTPGKMTAELSSQACARAYPCSFPPPTSQQVRLSRTDE